MPCPAEGMDSCLRRNDGKECRNDGNERRDPSLARPPTPSSSRKRGSIPCLARLKAWIPAFAGMTASKAGIHPLARPLAPSSSRMRGSIPLPCPAEGMDSCLRRNDANEGSDFKSQSKSGKAAAMSCRCLAALPNSAQRVAAGLALGGVFVVGRSAHRLQAAVGRAVQAQAVCGVFQQALQYGLARHGRVAVTPFI